MKEPYRSQVDLYDRIHRARGKDYAAEAAHIAGDILERNPEAVTLLDAACGTGKHLVHFAERFTCWGVDASDAMLAAARRRIPHGIDVHRGDLRTFRFERSFDAVTCLASSIGYLRPLPEMRRAVANLARHLTPGGVLIVEPWIVPDRWIDDTPFEMDVVEDADGHLVRMSRSERDERTTRLEMHYLAGSAAAVEYLAEEHVLEMYTFDEYADAFEAAGLEASIDPEGPTGRGLVLGVER